jgi:hypothetical protein
MNLRHVLLSAGALILGLASLQAQGPLYDKVMVNLPYSVTIADKTLQPGDYVIRQLPSASDSRVLLIYSDNGMKFETSAMTIPTLDNRTPEDTKVVLHHFGPDYYFDKIWIQGKNYGYEFPLPDSVKARMKERLEPINVAARYESVPAENESAKNTQTTTQESTTTTQQETTAQNTAPAETPAPAPEVAQNTQPENNAAQTTQPESNTVAQNTQPETSMANRAMPETSANWLLMLMSGGALSGLGLALRRKH